MKMRPITLIPEFEHHPWGGTRLIEEYNKPAEQRMISESWELCCKGEHLTRVDDVLCPPTLSETLKKYGWRETIGTFWNNYEDFPLLVKLIDASHDTPVSVCPDEQYAREHEDCSGRTKLIYIADCLPNSYIYYGLLGSITQDNFYEGIENKTLTSILRKVPVQKGDHYLIEPGTIHGLSAGCLAVEIQQNCNISYDILGSGCGGMGDAMSAESIKKAADVVKLSPSKKFITIGHIAKTEYFTADYFKGDKKLRVSEKSFYLLICLEGEGKLNWSKGCLPIKKGGSIFIPANTGDYSIEGTAEGILVTM